MKEGIFQTFKEQKFADDSTIIIITTIETPTVERQDSRKRERGGRGGKGGRTIERMESGPGKYRMRPFLETRLRREAGRRGIVAPPAPRFCSISQNRSSVPDQGSNTRSLHARRDHRLPRYTTKNISRPAMLSCPPSIYIGTVAANDRPSIERAFHPPPCENRTDERVISRLFPSFRQLDHAFEIIGAHTATRTRTTLEQSRERCCVSTFYDKTRGSLICFFFSFFFLES